MGRSQERRGGRRPSRSLLLAATLALTLLISLGAFGLWWARALPLGLSSGQAAYGPSTRLSSGFSWRVDSGASPQDLAEMKQAVTNALARHPVSLPPNEEIRFDGVDVAGDWAVTEGLRRNAITNDVIGGEGLIIILHKANGTWQAAYPGTAKYETWLGPLPNTLISPDAKQVL